VIKNVEEEEEEEEAEEEEEGKYINSYSFYANG
jgi:hypothetical protein